MPTPRSVRTVLTAGRARPLVRSAAAVLLVVVTCAGRAPGQSCAGDCNADRSVGINELITCVNIALGNAAVTACASCDPSGDGAVVINELVGEVNNALTGCPTAERPDLVPVSARFRSMTPGCINDTSEIVITLQVCVANRGSVDSGPFVVHVIGEPFAQINSLGAGAELCVEGPFIAFDIDVFVDADDQVDEADEQNNFRTFFIPQPTAPPFCTVTPTVTPTAPPTDTPTATPTDTETAVPTDTATPTVTETETSTPLPTDTAAPSATPTDTPTAVPTDTSAPTVTPTATESVTPTATETATPTTTESSPTPTDTVEPSATPTETETPAPGETETALATATPTETSTAPPTDTPAPPTTTPTDTPTPEPSATPTPTAGQPTPTATDTPGSPLS
jgi:hypothetical protein